MQKIESVVRIKLVIKSLLKLFILYLQIQRYCFLVEYHKTYSFFKSDNIKQYVSLQYVSGKNNQSKSEGFKCD